MYEERSTASPRRSAGELPASRDGPGRLRCLGHRAPLLWALLPLLTGLYLAHAGLAAPGAWGGAAAFGLAGFALVARLRKWRPSYAALSLGAALIIGGCAHYHAQRPRLADWDWLPPREAELALRVTRTFSQSRAGQTSGLALIEGTAPHLRELIGQRTYFSLTLPEGEATPLRGSVVDAIGVIKALPRAPAPNSFEHYLDSAGVNFHFAQGALLETLRPASTYRQFCARMAARFSRALGRSIDGRAPESAAILRAMLLGQRSELSETQGELFRRSGTMHVFAISGLHIGVIAGAIYWLLAWLRLPRGLRVLLGLGALWLYVDITGAAPSAVRAFTMVALLGLAFALRLPINPIAALCTSALLVACLDPLQVFSASFQLSYGTVAALLLIGLPLAETWQASWQPYALLPEATWSWRQRAFDWGRRALLGALGISVAASLVSAVAGVRFFELFTPSSLLINLIVIPAASLAIVAGFLSILCELVQFALGSVAANYIALGFLWLTEYAIRSIMKVPYLWFSASFRAPWIGPATLAALLLVLLGGYAQSWRGWFRLFWPPFALVALSFIFGVRFS